ncbi:MAG: arginase family protein, partial [Verrucomicrobiota bacterium]
PHQNTGVHFETWDNAGSFYDVSRELKAKTFTNTGVYETNGSLSGTVDHFKSTKAFKAAGGVSLTGISFDLDSLDPSFADAVGTPVPYGLNLEEFLKCFALFQETPPLAFELVEYNPDLDTKFHSLNAIKRILHCCNTLHKKPITSS